MKYSPEVYFKTTNEMRRLFKDLPEACDNTLRIAEMCNVAIPRLDQLGKVPAVRLPDGSPREDTSRKSATTVSPGATAIGPGRTRTCAAASTTRSGSWRRWDSSPTSSSPEDFVKWAKDNGVPVGPGRGSAAGSLVAYVLGITDLCPLRFGLIFERFLNPSGSRRRYRHRLLPDPPSRE